MRVTYLRCDQCKAERLPDRCSGWLTVMPTTDFGPHFDLDEDSRHFCTIACLTNWALRRQLMVGV